MPHYDVPNDKLLHTDWFHGLTDAQIKALPAHGGNIADVYAHISTFFDAHLADRSRYVCVTLNCPNPWPQVLDALYGASGNDVDLAGMFLGNLYCRVAIKRPEMWYSAPLPIFKNRADPNKWVVRRYIVSPEWRGTMR